MWAHQVILYYQAYSVHGKSNSEFKLEDAAEVARELIAEARADPPPPPNLTAPSEWGGWWSFWAYPIAEALAVLGYYHMQTGLRMGTDANEARNHFTEAAKHYLESADTFPQDDEKHSCESMSSLFHYSGSQHEWVHRLPCHCC